MSTRCTDIVWQELDVSGAEKLLLLAVADISNHEGDNIHPSNEYLVWLTGIPLRTVQHFKSKWRESGAMVPVENEKGGAGNFVRYQLNLSVFPRKTEWEGKGAKAASLRKRRQQSNGEQKDAITTSLAEGKGARVASLQLEEGCNGAQSKGATGAQKGATSDIKGCNGEQRNKEEPLVNKNLTVKGNQIPPSPTIVIAREKLAEYIRRNGPYPAEMEYDRKMFQCILAGRGGLTPTQVKEFLAEDPEWRKWPYLELLDSQQEIVFPEPPKPQPQSAPEPEPPWWERRLSPEQYERAKNKALEYLSTYAAKQSTEQVRRELGLCLGTHNVNGVDEFIESVQQLEATA